ncbi:ras GTPase-activating-like protein IQGAP1 isoform X2 [Eriocheir sinensis]|uniref:ras GTPase-activating-like protein IQGAP1 isoform X2 n=1 Tax=Eriocheir sinensis TaxID=95602 RepID=UPI0021C62CD1|nr:ras GTPase-activating-like protein IQGAP1 isoform X2 [Eriocheir sinensis]
MAGQHKGGGNGCLDAQEMDEQRQKNVSYQYLCHLEEAKKWMEACIEEELPEAGELEEQLRHGVYLAKLAHFFAPTIVPLRKIYDADLSRFRASGLTFRHTDNINHFLKGLEKIKLPSIFYPETTDVYDRKNMPRVVFCLHALSLYLFRLGIAPQIQNLYGKVMFSEEVMEAMMKELGKYGCQLPQFGKIGGILASELPVDEAALHAVVIAVNEAVEKRDCSELLGTLGNPMCHLNNVCEANAEVYLVCLADAKARKKEMAINKSRDQDYIPDAYDELLTQAEIQGHINLVNVLCALEKVEDAVRENDSRGLLQALHSPTLALKEVNDSLAENYLKALAQELEEPSTVQSLNHSHNYSLDATMLRDTSLTKASLQSVIITVKREAAATEQKVREGIAAVNRGLSQGSPGDTLQALRSLGGNISSLLDFAAPLYHEEMGAIREDAGADLSLEEIQGGVRLLSAVARANAALSTRSPAELWLYLSDPHMYLEGLEETNLREYFRVMNRAQQAKISSGDPCPFLTYLELQQLVDEVNLKVQEDNDKIGAITAINKAVSSGEPENTLTALQHSALQLGSSVSRKDALHHHQLLKLLRSAKSEMMGSSASELWLEDIVEVVEAVERHAEEAGRVAGLLAALNQALNTANDSNAVAILRSHDLGYLRIKGNAVPSILDTLKQVYQEKSASKNQSSWVIHTLNDGSKVHLDLKQGDYQWEQPEEVVSPQKSCYVTLSDLEGAVSRVVQQEAHSRQMDQLVVRLQARARGWLIRRMLHRRQEAALTIQTWWRMARARRTYTLYCQALRLSEPYVIRLQRAVRAWLHRRRLRRLQTYFTQHVNQVVAIQRAWRAHKARQVLHSITHQENPPMPVIRKFIHLLDVSESDLDEEFRLQRVKSDIVKTIRHTHQLEKDVDDLDVKIGLLVHNRITLQDVIPADKENMNPNIPDSKPKKNKKNSRDTLKHGSVRSQRGLKALNKESREKLLGYQHLFYLLQTRPHYLATLIFAIPPGKTTKFIENVIFTLYNYGANDRDNFLLLKLLKTALEEEIRCKVLRLSDIVSGNPLVVKMIVSFNRRGAGQASLRDMLGPLIHKVLTNNSMLTNTNPVEIYKTWVNQLEMNSGQASGLPYSVSQEQALQYPEVQKRLAQAITTLKEVTQAFCDQITSSRDMIPYAMLYMARVMQNALQRRFPHIPEKEILKVVGNLVYYRYINSAIVAPDAFDIVTVAPDQKLNNNQRRNLASIAKILQFAASKKGFGDEASHLKCLNPFIVECHEKFKSFFRQCCEVDEPEVVYNVTQYSEATLIVKPTIYITVQEICETHQLLLDHKEILAPDQGDPLHDVLAELGERPSVHALVGEAMESGTATLGRMELCLALTNKFDMTTTTEDKEPKDGNKLFNRTKQLLVDVIRCVDGNAIGELVVSPTRGPDEEKYRAIMLIRAQQEHQAKLNHAALNRSPSFLSETRVSLHEVKTRLSHNLRRLENQGLASRTTNYQSLLNAIAADIVNQRQHRISRRMELQRLLGTAKQLENKKAFYKEQLQSYQTYLKTCLSNIAARNKNVHQSLNGNKGRNKQALKYTAARLMEKGVLLEVEDLPDCQQKNLLFEITPLATTGVFHIQAKLMGVTMENVEIDIQELLQLQYEGMSVKKMFSKVKVNVNLLLHLLNTKFYSKKK